MLEYVALLILRMACLISFADYFRTGLRFLFRREKDCSGLFWGKEGAACTDESHCSGENKCYANECGPGMNVFVLTFHSRGVVSTFSDLFILLFFRPFEKVLIDLLSKCYGYWIVPSLKRNYVDTANVARFLVSNDRFWRWDFRNGNLLEIREENY